MDRNDNGEILVTKRVDSSKGRFVLSVIYEDEKFELRIKIRKDNGDVYDTVLPLELLRPFRNDLDVR